MSRRPFNPSPDRDDHTDVSCDPRYFEWTCQPCNYVRQTDPKETVKEAVASMAKAWGGGSAEKTMPSISNMAPVGLFHTYRLLASPPVEHRYSWRLSDDIPLRDSLEAHFPSKTYSTLDQKSIWVILDRRAFPVNEAEMQAAIVELERKVAQRHDDYKRVDATLHASKADKRANSTHRHSFDKEFKDSVREIADRAGLITGTWVFTFATARDVDAALSKIANPAKYGALKDSSIHAIRADRADQGRGGGTRVLHRRVLRLGVGGRHRQGPGHAARLRDRRTTDLGEQQFANPNGGGQYGEYTDGTARARVHRSPTSRTSPAVVLDANPAQGLRLERLLRRPSERLIPRVVCRQIPSCTDRNRRTWRVIQRRPRRSPLHNHACQQQRRLPQRWHGVTGERDR